MDRNYWSEEKLFLRLMNNRSQRTYWDNIAVLWKKPSKTIFDKSVELIRSENAKFREIGINVLAQLGIRPRPYHDETLKLYFKLLVTEKETRVISTLLYAIGHNNHELNKVQIELLTSFKNHKDNFVRESLVFALLGVDNTIAVNTLIHLSKDTSGSVRNWATFGIGTLIERDDEIIREALWNRVNDRNPDAKFEAIAGLAKRKDDRIKSVIEKELQKGDSRSLIFEAITGLGDLQFLPILKSRLSNDEQNENVSSEWLKDLKKCIIELENKPI